MRPRSQSSKRYRISISLMRPGCYGAPFRIINTDCPTCDWKEGCDKWSHWRIHDMGPAYILETYGEHSPQWESVEDVFFGIGIDYLKKKYPNGGPGEMEPETAKRLLEICAPIPKDEDYGRA